MNGRQFQAGAMAPPGALRDPARPGVGRAGAPGRPTPRPGMGRQLKRKAGRLPYRAL